MHRVARKLGAREDEVDDVVQEVFIIAHRRLATFTHGKLPTWLYKITSNLVFSRNRGRRLRETLFSWFSGGDAQDEVVGPERLVEAREAERDVAKILSRMSDKKREVFVLFELEGLTGPEIAEHLGLAPGTVASRLRRARADFEAATARHLTQTRRTGG